MDDEIPDFQSIYIHCFGKKRTHCSCIIKNLRSILKIRNIIRAYVFKTKSVIFIEKNLRSSLYIWLYNSLKIKHILLNTSASTEKYLTKRYYYLNLFRHLSWVLHWYTCTQQQHDLFCTYYEKSSIRYKVKEIHCYRYMH